MAYGQTVILTQFASRDTLLSKLPPTADVPHWKRNLRIFEGVVISLITLSLYLMLALVTYDESDPGWTHAASSQNSWFFRLSRASR